jgi:hypothetical protein
MKNRKSDRHGNPFSGRDPDDLLMDPEWSHLQESLRDMVSSESEHVEHALITNNILRAVRKAPAGMPSLDDLWERALVSWFRPVVVAAVLLILLLAAYNVRQTSSDALELTTTERILGLHPVTVASAYDVELESISR